MSDEERDIPSCECGLDYVEHGRLTTVEAFKEGIRNPRTCPQPDVICEWCGASAGATYGSDVAVEIWEVRGEPLPGNESDNGEDNE